MANHKYPLGSLRVFETAARLVSITKAAAELNVTPGAVSQQVRQLEQSLQVELFVRQHRGLALTDGGRLLAVRLTSCFEEIDRAVRDVAGDPGSKRLRLKVTPSFAIRWLVPRLTSFYQQHPDFEVEVGTYPRQEDALVEEVDFVVRHGDGKWDDVEGDLAFHDALVPVCSPRLAALLKTPADLADQVLLHSMMRTDAWPSWFAHAGLGAMRSRRTMKLANAAVSYQAAIDGLGVALAQIPYVRDDLASGRLVMPFAEVFHSRLGYYFTCAKRKANQPNIRLFRKWVRSLQREESAAAKRDVPAGKPSRKRRLAGAR